MEREKGREEERGRERLWRGYIAEFIAFEIGPSSF